MIGKKASRENLIESILYPSKAIADQYLNWNIETKKGVTITGLLVEETPDHIVLRDANGKDTRIDTKDIESRTKNPNSLMPERHRRLHERGGIDGRGRVPADAEDAVADAGLVAIAGPFDNGADRRRAGRRSFRRRRAST